MPGMSIGDVSRRAGLATSTIRYYERIGLLPAPERLSGQRRYDHSVLRRLSVIETAKASGFTLAEIRRLLFAFPDETTATERWRQMSTVKLDEIDQQIAELERVRDQLARTLECRCQSLDDCARTAGNCHV